MSDAIPCQAVSWNQVERLVRALAHAIRGAKFEPDVVVAIARGGFVPARLLCDQLGVMNLASFRIEHYRGQHREPLARVAHPLAINVQKARVLVVDDLSDTGDTFDLALRHLQECGAGDVRTAALHHKQGARVEPDFYAQRIRTWRWLSYPWARMEDLRALMQELESPPGDALEMATRLRAKHGLRVPLAEVEQALRLMDVS